VTQLLAGQGNTNLELTEIIQFFNYFYFEVEEKCRGIHVS